MSLFTLFLILQKFPIVTSFLYQTVCCCLIKNLKQKLVLQVLHLQSNQLSSFMTLHWYKNYNLLYVWNFIKWILNWADILLRAIDM